MAMTYRLLSMLDPPPPGFRLQDVQKRDLLSGAVAVYCSSAESLYPLVEMFCQRVAGVLIVTGDGFRQEQLGTLLWRMTLPSRLQSAMRVLVEPLLAAIETALAQREKAVELGSTLNRLRYDLDIVRGDYLRVTAKLQSQVAQLVETQAELVQGEAELRAILDLLPQLIYASDERGRLLLANASFARKLGLSDPQLACGQEVRNLNLPARWLGQAALEDSLVWQSKAPRAMADLQLLQADGELSTYEVLKLPWTCGGQEAVLTVLHDVSARHAVEAQMVSLNEELEKRVQQRTGELQQANRELESFSYSVAHDLRSPLRAVMGFSQILEAEAGNLDGEQRDMLQRVQAAAVRMSQLIDDLLMLAQASRMQLERRPLDIAALGRQVWQQFAHLRGDRQVVFECEPALPAVADSRLVQLVLEQLLTNAIKFTRGSVEAKVELGHLLLGDETVYVVRDNGVGFDMAAAEKLFMPFQRLHSTAQFEGSGIGLATARRAISRHGGRIWAEAQPGLGAQFYFTLPDG
ncbi:hypothetical protein GCM10007907_40990 [Chitinimonas prasina]|uniref:histidine kinase n=2 Tax=Chitinimonas prasina TaxID=1434937 RepID=A0ABQ5YL33_9NEIS|nr:hypothetical protein GCM10007907_40990 [Chitinimonas prasina]